MAADYRSVLPSVDSLLTDDLVTAYGQARATYVVRMVIAKARTAAADGVRPERAELSRAIRDRLDNQLRPVINATGVLLHTNLGRAPWSESARNAATGAMGYTSVELDLTTGKRGGRGAGVEERLCALTGAQAALVVNNCAGAVMHLLSALAKDRTVLVSRGELVEIGGGFRVPDVMRVSGATLREVGTTNRTHLDDFARELDDSVAAVMRIHHSNFRQIGFVTRPDLKALASLETPLWVDLGSGQLDLHPDEPSLREALDAGAEVVCMSGDKLLGGPQAGLILGQSDAIETLRRHPLYRALRPGKVILAALEGTLDDWLRNHAVPLVQMRTASMESLRTAVEHWRDTLDGRVPARILDVDGAIGGGSLPGRTWPSVALALRPKSVDSMRSRLLAGPHPVVARAIDGELVLDARTVVPLGQGDALLSAVVAALDVTD